MSIVLFVAVTLVAHPAGAETAVELQTLVASALERAGDNRSELEAARRRIEDDMKKGMDFLIAYMPPRDLQTLQAEYLLENVRYAYQAWREAPWHARVSEDLFLNNVLPYASVSERRDRWRKRFYEQFKPLIKDAQTPGEAAVILNQKIFPLTGVRYSTKRRRADQGPLESIELGLASCTGLSVLLIDACRAVGVPARLAGTPLWSDKSGNHSWVEVWDGTWHFTGAAEPAGNDLDRAWFLGRASRAQRDHRLHAIYAVSYRKTPQVFPMVWARDADPVWAVNVTDRYTAAAKKLPPGWARVMFQALENQTDRCAANVRVTDQNGNVVFQGKTNDERFDRNDHVTTELKLGENYQVEIFLGGRRAKRHIQPTRDGELVTVSLATSDEKPKATAGGNPLRELKSYLKQPHATRPPLAEQSFAQQPLSKQQAQLAGKLLWEDHRRWIRESRRAEMDARVIKLGNVAMPFWYKVFGKPGRNGRSLYISMHGGGGAPKQVNDQQWENQKRLYAPKEGVYVAPRAPTNTWNLWHQAHIDPLFYRLIENLIVFENVDPDRVYLMGYSAGGDGVYQLAPRMADSLAAASMMAGHPNETSPLGLRNLPFSLHVGGDDAAYRRNQIGREWKAKLEQLQKADPGGFIHWAKIYEGKGHWLDREDAAAVEWMAQFTRRRFPDKVVWKQDDVTHRRFYWLAVPKGSEKARAELVVRRDGQQFVVEKSDVSPFELLLNDAFVDLDKPIGVSKGSQVLWEGRAVRTIQTLYETLVDRGDPQMVFSAQVAITMD